MQTVKQRLTSCRHSLYSELHTLLSSENFPTWDCIQEIVRYGMEVDHLLKELTRRPPTTLHKPTQLRWLYGHTRMTDTQFNSCLRERIFGDLNDK